MRGCVAILCGVLASGCAGGPPVIDNSPRYPAAVRVEDVALTGGKGYFPYEGRQVTWTRPTIRRVEQDVDFTASALGAFGAGAERAYLFSLDEPRLVQIDYDSESYHRCDPLGCYEYSEATRSVEPQLPVLGGPGCTLRVHDAQVTLSATPDTREIAGYSATRHTFEWRVTVEDGEGRLGVSRLHGDVWLSEAAAATQATRTEREFQRAYRKRIGLDWGSLGDLLPSVPWSLVESYFLTTLTTSDRDLAMDVALERDAASRDALQGELVWEIAGRACGWQPAWRRNKAAAQGNDEHDSREPESEGDGVETLGDFISGIAAELSGENQEPEAIDEVAATSEGASSELPAGRTVATYRWAAKALVSDEVTQNGLRIPSGYKEGTRF